MPYEKLIYDKDGKVVTITLNRPEAMNALSPDLEREMHQAVDEADADEDVRAIILTGAGRAFSAGFDLSGSGNSRSRPDPLTSPIGEYIKSWADRDFITANRLMHFWYTGTPIIAAINGFCMGGGFWYSLACDISIASEQAVFAQPEVRDVSNTTFLLAALCGWKVTNRYALTGDHFDAPEALRIGVVNEVVPHDQLMTRARALADRLALVPEPSVRYNKYVTTLGLEAAGLRAGLLVNATLSVLVHSSHNSRSEELKRVSREQGLRAFLELRDGPFQPEPFGPRSRPRQ